MLELRARSLRTIALLAALAAPIAGPALHPAVTLAQAPSGEEAQRFLTRRHDEVNRLLRQPASEARNRRLGELLDGLLDYQELARRALARHWDARSEDERRQFTDLLQQLVARSYQDNLQRTLRFEVDYVGHEAQGEAVIVRTRARSRENRRAQPIEIDYSMRKAGDAWRVFDVHTDGVSLVENYRSQFNRIIDREGFAGLLARMRARLEAGTNDL